MALKGGKKSKGKGKSKQKLLEVINMPNYKASYIDMNKDELKHWKYIKKIPNGDGTFRYFYKETSGLGLKTAWDLAKAKARLRTAGQAQERVAKDYDNRVSGLSYKPKDAVERISASREYDKNLSNASRHYQNAIDDYGIAYKNFVNSPIGKIPKAIMDIGETIAMRILSRKRR